MEQKLKKVLQYFSFFDYYPTSDEIYTFFPVKINEKRLKTIIEAKKYTVGEYSKKYQISKNKLQNLRFKTYIKILSTFSQIKLVGLSGSIAMMNADLDDDIDLFIISSKNFLFTARFLATIFAIIMGLKRKTEQHKAPNKVCLNLFFDKSNLAVPDNKKTEFVAHEILQMKPIIIKDNIYQKFLEANKWVQTIFPNSNWINSKVKNQKSKVQVKSQNYFKNFKLFTLTSNFLLLTFNLIELILKKAQLSMINRHRTTEIITDSQLWFHPVDFGKKIKRL